MKQADIIRQMCRVELVQADIKAICKFRQFATPQSASAEIVETLLTSDVGLKQALGSLTQKEVTMLHFLAAQEKPVDISAFGRVSALGGHRYTTFTRRYQNVLKDVKNRFVRKGLLAFYTDPSGAGGKTKMERIRLCLPIEFQAHLPGMIDRPLKSDQSGTISEDRIRKLLTNISRLDGTPHGDHPDLTIDQNGCLRIKGCVFNMDNLTQWQYAQWTTQAAENMGLASYNRYSFDCLAALKVIFSSLNRDEWVRPDQLKPALDIFCDFETAPDIDRVCRLGWETGILRTADLDGGACYRLSGITDEPWEDTPEKTYVTDPETACIDFKKIPLPMLIRLARIARFRVENKKILAEPDPAMMGRQLYEIRNTPWLCRLINHLPEFKKLFQTLEKNWGKEIVHRDLRVAQIKHIGLKASLEKTFSNEAVLFLPNGFIAFPKGLESQIEKTVIQQGFAVKRAKS
ncbi:hypothetical protein [Desulfobacter vibrioformis]|uniref:hypothetical protein n=1 Tax=Desulfobacter vibrioformis TaxID=34031 RepID=UPI0005541D3A|nr:hypothetical protein [Desulfobacter vibrioformis]